jgi:hypothetical protein
MHVYPASPHGQIMGVIQNRTSRNARLQILLPTSPAQVRQHAYAERQLVQQTPCFDHSALSSSSQPASTLRKHYHGNNVRQSGAEASSQRPSTRIDICPNSCILPTLLFVLYTVIRPATSCTIRLFLTYRLPPPRSLYRTACEGAYRLLVLRLHYHYTTLPAWNCWIFVLDALDWRI